MSLGFGNEGPYKGDEGGCEEVEEKIDHEGGEGDREEEDDACEKMLFQGLASLGRGFAGRVIPHETMYLTASSPFIERRIMDDLAHITKKPVVGLGVVGRKTVISF